MPPPFVRLVFDSFSPDRSDFELDGCEVVENLRKYSGRWQPFPAVAQTNLAIANTIGLTGGAWTTWARADPTPREGGSPPVTPLEGAYYSVQAGADCKIVHGSGNVVGTFVNSVADLQFTTFLQSVIAVGEEVELLYRTAVSETFVPMVPSGTKPRALFCCTCRNRLILGYCYDPTDSLWHPTRIWHSARLDPTADWAPGPLSNDPAWIDLRSNLGFITGLAAFEDSFIVLRERGVELFTYKGGEEIWHRRRVGGPLDGTNVRTEIAVNHRDAYYWAWDGFRAIVDGQVVDLTQGLVKQFFRDDVDPTAESPRACVLPRWGSVGFIYQSRATGAARVALLNLGDGAWSYADPDLPAGGNWYLLTNIIDADGDATPTLLGHPDTPTGTIHRGKLSGALSRPVTVKTRKVRFAEGSLGELHRARVIYGYRNINPSVSLTVEHAEDPELVINKQTTVLDNGEIDREGFFLGLQSGHALPARGPWFQFTAQVPAHVIEDGLREMPALEVDFG